MSKQTTISVSHAVYKRLFSLKLQLMRKIGTNVPMGVVILHILDENKQLKEKG